ncbi:WD REPEATS REGION domain-containing protein [Citrus sinensis]|uniref:WD REPEATS REGION domain-containing protein n=1 Tax=Citrus sinensis TaxID=2711 RepID=A0ACB8MZB4_CITSI|nr:WD REPEATS REGION domain-containing protein [Citrus sinensis]
MATPKSESFFLNVRSRELNGFKARKRPYFGDVVTDFTEIGAVTVEHHGEETPPLAVSFCKTSKNSHIFAVSDEDGYVSLFDSRRKLPSFACHRENAEKARISDWVAHQNAIFDLCWIKEDTNILTASGDQTVNILVSGSRDGSFAIWDLRCKSSPKSNCAESFVFSSAVVKGAHLLSQSKRVSCRKFFQAASMSITSVLYLKDEVSIATASAVNSIVKFWDTRNLKAQITQAWPHAESSSAKETRLHGISSLSQDSNGVFLTASCMDHRIYLYNVLQLDKGPIQHFSGCRIESFYVKSEICPNASHILSGSSDGNAYVWQVNKPQADPIKLKSHDGEVTAVDWCPNEAGKIVTSSDDYTVRLWSLENSRFSSMRSPSSVRRRVMAIPSTECRKLFMNGEPGWLAKGSDSSNNSDDVLNQINSSDPKNMPIIRTPEAQKKKIPSFDTKEAFEKTPEASLNSPSSVLNPPSSVKRKTIRDYFLVTP